MLAFDVTSGAPLASTSLLASADGPVLEERRNRLVVPDFEVLRGSIVAVSADSLGLLGRVTLPVIPYPPPEQVSGGDRTHDVDVSSVSATIFVLDALSGLRLGSGYFCESQLIALEADTGRVRRTVNTTGALGEGACGAELVRVTEPAPPTAGTVDVVGHQVTLAWQAPFGTTHYELEVGTAPGLANIGGITVAEPGLVVENVPSGVYYLRPGHQYDWQERRVARSAGDCSVTLHSRPNQRVLSAWRLSIEQWQLAGHPPHEPGLHRSVARVTRR